MQRYFSNTCICDSTDVQADWRRSCTYGRAHNAIDISQGFLTCPSYTDTGPPFLYGDSDTSPQLVTFYNTLGIRMTYSRFKPPGVLTGANARMYVTCRNFSRLFTLNTLLYFLDFALDVNLNWKQGVAGLIPGGRTHFYFKYCAFSTLLVARQSLYKKNQAWHSTRVIGAKKYIWY